MPAKSTRSGNAKRLPKPTGKAAGLFGLPVELIYLVFSFLDPFDLLQLARSAHFLRASLMTKGNSTIWIQARENVPNLPPRPEQISEPRYASLLFDKHCDQCGLQSRTTFPIYDLNIRVCRTCNKEISPQYLYWNAGLSPEVLRDFEGISHSFVRHTLSVNRIVQALNSADGDKERSEAALEELRAEFRSTKQIGEVWCKWNTILSVQSRKAMQLLREGRTHEIARRVRGLGYGDVIEQNRHTWDQVRGARVSKALTEQSWEELRPRLVGHLEFIRNRQQWDADLETLGARCRSFRKAYNNDDWSVVDQTLGKPSASDLFLFEGVQQRLLHQDFPLTEEDLIGWIQALARHWQNQVKQIHASYLPPVLGVTAANVTNCIFAQFACNHCRTSAIIRGEPSSAAFDLAGSQAHACFRKTIRQLIPKGTEASDQGDHYRLRKVLTDRSLGVARTLSSAWAPGSILMPSEVATQMATILNAEEGRRPLLYSESGEPIIDTLYFCSGCTPNLNEVAIMTWRGALHHYQGTHAHGQTAAQWCALNPQMDSYVRVMRPLRFSSWVWKCTHCSLTDLRCYHETELAIHLLAEHDIFDPCTREPDMFAVPRS